MSWHRRGRSQNNSLHRRARHSRRLAIERLERRCLLTAYTWQNAAIGGGGFVDGIFYDPHNQNVIYARTDIGGLYKTVNGGTSWNQLLDFVGNSTASSGNGTQFQEMGVLAFAIDPQNSNNIYADVGEYSGTNGAVFYSTNGGQTWGQTNLSFYVGGNSNGRGNGEQIAVDPNNSNILFLGTNDHGLWQSTDAGHSFSRINTSLFAPTSTTFVLFDPASGTPGNASQTIYVGINSTSTGTNLYVTSDGGANWSQVTGTGALPSGFLPGRAVLSGGNLYLGYANAQAPNGNITNGGLFRYTPASGAWSNISPLVPSANAQFGYDAVAADPQNPNTLVVTSFDYYSGPDMIWRTVDASIATPSWTSLMDTSSAQNFGYGGYNVTRSTANAPWVAAFGDGIGNWAASVAINPFNSNQLMYGTGQGIWATNNASNGGANTKLTAPGSWYFPDNGIEFTAVQKLIAPQTGVPLFSAIGDINGFAHTTLTSSPAGGGIGGAITGGGLGTMNSIDFAQSVPNAEVVVGAVGAQSGAYTTNDGATWTEFAARPAGNASSGTVAISASGGTILWAASAKTPYYSTNDGTTWTASTMPSGTLTGGTVVSDRINSNILYYWTENASDNQWKLYISNDAGHTFAQTGAALANGNITLIASPLTSGDLWFSSYNGVYHSTNFGASFTQLGSIGFSNVPNMALGAIPPGKSYPSIYVYGTIGGFMGVYRSDDAGTTWTLLNDLNHQWGGLVDSMAADPNVFGRVYLGTNGRGIIVGNPANSLPAGWADADINSPGNPGWATNSTTLSSGTVVTGWTVDGGGAGISGTSDQFNFAYQPISGNAVISAQLTALTNADGGSGTPEAGVMLRAGQGPSDPFVALVQTAGNTLVFKYRSASGGSVVSSNLGGIPVGAEHLRLANNGNSFTGYYSADGVAWSQLGPTITIPGIPSTDDIGLVATAGNAQLTSAKFAQVAIWPQGDINGDGQRDIADVQALMAALSDLSNYQAQRALAGTDLLAIADMTGDGQVTNTDVQALINVLAAAAPPAQNNSSSLVSETSSQNPVSSIATLDDALNPPASEPAITVAGDFRNVAQWIPGAVNERNIAMKSSEALLPKRALASVTIDPLVSKKLPSVDRRMLPSTLNRSRSHDHVRSAANVSELDMFFASLPENL
jgi:hypothetical protein